MKLTQGARDCLIAYSRKPDNLPSALAIGAIHNDLKNAILKEFQDELCDYVRDGLKPSWSIHREDPVNWAGGVLILSLKHEGSDGEIGVSPNHGGLAGPTLLKVTFPMDQSEAIQHGLRGKESNWWKYLDFGRQYTWLFSAEALTEMNTKEGRREFVKHYGEELLKYAGAIETLIRRGSK